MRVLERFGHGPNRAGRHAGGDKLTLERVRIKCTAIEDRIIAVTAETTGEDLKDKVYSALYNAEHEWYNSKGVRQAVTGATVLASRSVPADDKAGTAAMEHGDEFVTAEPLGREEFGKGKVVSVVRASRGGALCAATSSTVMARLVREHLHHVAAHASSVSARRCPPPSWSR